MLPFSRLESDLGDGHPWQPNNLFGYYLDRKMNKVTYLLVWKVATAFGQLSGFQGFVQYKVRKQP